MRIELIEEVRKREPSLPAVEDVRDREQRRENRAHWRWRKWETESRGERTKLTGGGGSERQRAEERESVCREDENRVEWLRSFSFQPKRRVLASPRTRLVPEPTRPVPKPYWKFFFFCRKRVRRGYACSGSLAVSVPTRYPVRVRRGFCRTGAS